MKHQKVFPAIGKKSTRSLQAMLFDKNNHCLYERWRFRFEYNAMIVTFKYVVSCDILDVEESFQGTCFGHAFSKVC